MTCVDEADCSCKSHSGEPVTSGAVSIESECEICQCINNYYTCDRSSCTNLINNTSTGISYSPTNATTFFEPEESTTPSLEKHTFIVPSTVHPPAVCVSNNFIPLIQYLNDQVTFDASTSKGPMFPYIDLPLKDKVLKNSDRFWEPVYNDINQW